MFTNSKISRSLVWLSLLLLLIFLCYWNVNQYQAEKNELVQDLNNQMSLAYSKYNDSLFTSIIAILRSSDDVLSSSTFTINNKFEKGQGDITVHTHSGNSQRDTNISIMISSNQNFENNPSESISSLPLSIDMIKSLLKDKGNLEMSYNSDSVPTVDQIEVMSNESKKSNLYINKYFAENLLALNLPTAYEEQYLTEGSPNAKDQIAVAYKTINTDKPKLYATFSDYQSYLYKKITPSLLMSVALFSIVALAFFMILKTTNEQKRLADIKSEFMSNMTHELKTPIATVGVALEALSDYGGLNDAKRKEEYLDISRHELNRLSILVDKVMQMSSFEKGAAVMEREPLDLKEITDQMINYMKLPFEKNKVNFNYELTGQRFNIHGDRVHLTNVLYNLIDNAIKYSDDEPAIDIHITEASKHIKFEIKDQGIGIPKEFQNKVFDRFFRVPTDNVHNVKGHGVGLNYVSDVIKKHKGELLIKSEVGKGTSIIFQIPKLS